RSGHRVQAAMKRDQFFGGIGIIWGGFTVMNWYWNGRPVTTADSPFALVYMLGAVTGAIMMTVGLFYFMRGSE
ncbi:MAG: hypothetical protein Q8N52_03400, partial [Acidobacteriota bacterium]|nr:hypothetical protein [Acidobacteriota bacterium]